MYWRLLLLLTCLAERWPMRAECGRETENELEGGKHRFFCLPFWVFWILMPICSLALSRTRASHTQEGGPKFDGTKPSNQLWSKNVPCFQMSSVCDGSVATSVKNLLWPLCCALKWSENIPPGLRHEGSPLRNATLSLLLFAPTKVRAPLCNYIYVAHFSALKARRSELCVWSSLTSGNPWSRQPAVNSWHGRSGIPVNW